ncbi:MAG: hypothetical protein ACYTDT_05215 [Planctomycetota bacterium]
MAKAVSKVKSTDHQQGLRDRLLQLTERYQQAEIATRTGTPPANVHRYLKAGKIPGEFLCAIVANFDVDPEWLLAGKGEQASSNVKAETAAKAGELLDLVKTMNAISRMRLGAIVKDRDRKLVRELGDALQTFDRLREKMNEQSAPVMKQLVEELQTCLKRMDMDRAKVIAHTATELSRICLDDELLLQLDSQLAGVAYLSGKLDEAIYHDRKVFARQMVNGVIETPDEIANCTNLVMLLRDSGHWEESRRVGEAVLALVPDLEAPIPALRVLQMMMGMMDVECGDVARGLARCNQIWPMLAGQHRVSETVMMVRVNLVTGIMNYFEAVEFGDQSMGKSRMLVRLAGAFEDPAMLKHAIDNLIGDSPIQIPPTEYDARRVLLIDRILAGKKAKITDFDTLAQDSPPVAAKREVAEMILALHRAQIARLLGNKKALRPQVQESIRCLRKVGPDTGLRIEFHFMHLRNLKALGGKTFDPDIAALQTELTAIVDAGIRGFASLLE